MIYFDNAATTKPLKIALEKFIKVSEENFANASSMHDEGKKTKKLIEEATFLFSRFINKNGKIENNTSKILFTFSATISNNIAIKGAIENLKSKNKKDKIKIIYSEADHPSIVQTIKSIKDIDLYNINLEKLYSKIQNNEDIENYIYSSYLNMIDSVKPDLIVLQWINSENGLILPVQKICEYAKLKHNDIFIHVDAVQGFLKIPFFDINNIDSISFSSHKFGGLKGCSILYIKDLKKIKPILFGGGQMDGIFPSTENVAVISSTIAVIDYLFNSVDLRYKKTLETKDKIINLLKIDNIISDEIFILTDTNINSINFSPYILKIYNKRLPAQVLQNMLNEKSIMVSIGSACSSNKKKMAKDDIMYGIPSIFSDKGIRISFFIDENVKQIEYFCSTYKEILKKFDNW